MDEKLLIGKGLFGLAVVGAFYVGIIDLKMAFAAFVFIYSLDHISDGVEIFRMKREMRRKEAGS
jgi:hypothetical protein